MVLRRTTLALLVACGMAMTLGNGVTAQIPPNDTCATATLLNCNDIVSGSTVGATPETALFCGTSDGTGGAVWYRFIGTGNEIELTTCAALTNYDTKLRVYTGDCGNLVCVTGNDDASCSFGGLRSRVTWISTVGVEYLIMVHGFSGSQGTYELVLTCLAPPAPDPNDDCVNATPLTCGQVILGDTQANNSDGETTCGSASNSPSIWYSVVATEELLRVQTCGSSLNTVVSIHSGCPGDLASQIDCDDNGCGLQSFLTIVSNPGSTYFIRVAGASGAAGPFTLRVDCLAPGSVTGPDVVYTDCTSVSNFGAIGGIRGYALGSFTCNIGDENLQWGGTTPLLAMNSYRLRNGRLEQIGMSFVKNGTGAAAGSGCGLACNGQGGGVLGAGCRDVYGSGFNGIQSILGPRSTVNAFTGAYPGASGPSGTLIDKRMQVKEVDLTGGGIYFIEGVYVAPDDALNGNALNNASYKQVTISGAFDMTPVGAMDVGTPCIQAWADHGLGIGMPDASVTVTAVDVPSEGRFHVASKVTDLGGGQWRYDYAIFNLNSHRSAGSFSVPTGPGVTVTNAGFHDVDYHTGEPYDLTDWSFATSPSAASWSSPQTFAQNQNSNALRWGTMYNFWFDADVAPLPVDATIGLFRPGTPDSITVSVPGPGVALEFRRGDCNADSSFNLADVVALLNEIFGISVSATCHDACDANDDGNLDVSDPVRMLDNLFASGPALPAPFPGCGSDNTNDAVGCMTYGLCP